MAERRPALLALLALLATLLLPSLARAHAELREASPAIGAVYRWERPVEVRLSFTQNLALEGSAITVVDRAFQHVGVGDPMLEPEDPSTIVAALPPLGEGTYTVSWRTRSVDGHGLEGSYDFTIQPRAPIVTVAVAAVVLLAIGALVFTRRAPPE